jgi:predicted metal-dependent hydrolase
MRLSIDPEHGLIATLPRRAKKFSKESQREIAERFIAQKSAWVQRTLKRFEKTSKTQSRKFTASEIAEYKKKALTLAAARLAYFNQFYGFTWARVSVRDQKTRWGSCSRKGNLNFNYKIALLEPALADYIVVHELCHLKQMNHLSAFWKLVEKTIPDYVERRAELRKGSISPG